MAHPERVERARAQPRPRLRRSCRRRSSRTRTCSSPSTSRASAARSPRIFTHYKIPGDHVIGVGYWGGARGYISHHVEVNSKVIRNYQIVAPTTFVAARDGGGAPSPLEQAVMATPSLSSQGHERHIDLLRTVRSFDLCMSCSSH